MADDDNWALAAYDYDLPTAHIAQEPVVPRDTSRLLSVPLDGGEFSEHRFFDLAQLLQSGDVLVRNRTRVIPARLRARRPTGGKAELLLVRPVGGDIATGQVWEALARPAKAMRGGTVLTTTAGTQLTVEERRRDRIWVSAREPMLQVLHREGEVPLPPYIERVARQRDWTDYQAIFSRDPGAVAAPTASLHFTERVMTSLRDRGIEFADVVLHVGVGTFLPVRQESEHDIRTHTMHAEAYEVPVATQEHVCRAREKGRRVIPIGTTALRALETWATTGLAQGESTLFIYPGYVFQRVDGLITNFHLPRSTLLMLVSAMAGRKRIMQAYRYALEAGFRFFSYGDAMLIA